MLSRGRTSARSAFTLIEILIVVVIIGILAAIILPNISQASEAARVNAAKSTLTTVRAQIELFKYKTDTLPADIDDFATLVPGYIQAVPTAEGYSYSITDGVVSVTDADGNDMGW